VDGVALLSPQAARDKSSLPANTPRGKSETLPAWKIPRHHRQDNAERVEDYNTLVDPPVGGAGLRRHLTCAQPVRVSWWTTCAGG
jgi:hypothetical protein